MGEIYKNVVASYYPHYLKSRKLRTLNGRNKLHYHLLTTERKSYVICPLYSCKLQSNYNVRKTFQDPRNSNPVTETLSSPMVFAYLYRYKVTPDGHCYNFYNSAGKYSEFCLHVFNYLFPDEMIVTDLLRSLYYVIRLGGGGKVVSKCKRRKKGKHRVFTSFRRESSSFPVLCLCNQRKGKGLSLPSSLPSSYQRF